MYIFIHPSCKVRALVGVVPSLAYRQFCLTRLALILLGFALLCGAMKRRNDKDDDDQQRISSLYHVDFCCCCCCHQL